MNELQEYQTKETLKIKIDREILIAKQETKISDKAIIEMLEELINLYKN